MPLYFSSSLFSYCTAAPAAAVLHLLSYDDIHSNVEHDSMHDCFESYDSHVSTANEIPFYIPIPISKFDRSEKSCNGAPLFFPPPSLFLGSTIDDQGRKYFMMSAQGAVLVVSTKQETITSIAIFNIVDGNTKR